MLSAGVIAWATPNRENSRLGEMRMLVSKGVGVIAPASKKEREKEQASGELRGQYPGCA
jgi:hypothetical protein